MAKMKGYSNSSTWGSAVKGGKPVSWSNQGGTAPATYSYKEQLMQMGKAKSIGPQNGKKGSY